MPRPRKGTEHVFYDTFADWPLDDQAAALKVLGELHRQKERDTRRGLIPNNKPVQMALGDTGVIVRDDGKGLFEP